MSSSSHSIRQRLLAGFVVSLVAAIIIAVASFSAVRFLIESKNNAATARIEDSLEIGNLRSLFERASSDCRGFLLTNHPKHFESYVHSMAQLEALLPAISKEAQSSETQQLLERARTLFETHEHRFRSARSRLPFRTTQEAALFFDENLFPIGQSIRSALDELVSRRNARLRDALVSSERAISGAMYLILIVAAIALSMEAILAAVIFYTIGSLSRRLEDSLRERSEALALVDTWQQATPVGFAFLNVSLRFVRLNERFREMCGYEPRDVTGRDFRDTAPPAAKPLLDPLLAVSKERKAITNRLIESGSSCWLVSCIPVTVGDDKIIGFSLTIIDVTQQHRLQRELHRLTEELKRSNEDLEQFAALASHDLQEPLRTISTYLRLLEKDQGGRLDKSGLEYISFATDGAARLRQLIEALLQYSRAGNTKLRPTRVDCAEAVGSVLRRLSIQLADTRADVRVESLPVVSGDDSLLEQLFQNLVGNALKYRQETPPQILIGAKETRDGYEFFVRDNGIGFSQDEADRIFELFRRLHTRGEYPGTGLGLAICKKIVERHGGEIWAESAPGKGSTFYFTLPSEKENRRVA